MSFPEEQSGTRRFADPVLVFATHNPGKKAELTTLLSGHGVECPSAADYGLSSPDETGFTFLENATIKARYVSQSTGLAALGDDSGFCVAPLADCQASMLLIGRVPKGTSEQPANACSICWTRVEHVTGQLIMRRPSPSAGLMGTWNTPRHD
jgi:hypothetical protein